MRIPAKLTHVDCVDLAFHLHYRSLTSKDLNSMVDFSVIDDNLRIVLVVFLDRAIVQTFSTARSREIELVYLPQSISCHPIQSLLVSSPSTKWVSPV
jgi:hypothetical protein